MSSEVFQDSDGVIQLFRALAHPARATVVHRLTEGPADVTTLTELLGISPPLVSHHLRTLRQAHLVEGTREGRRTSYRLVDEHVAHIFLDAHHHTKEHSNDCHH